MDGHIFYLFLCRKERVNLLICRGSAMVGTQVVT
jgi:hypothetical protein